MFKILISYPTDSEIVAGKETKDSKTMPKNSNTARNNKAKHSKRIKSTRKKSKVKKTETSEAGNI